MVAPLIVAAGINAAAQFGSAFMNRGDASGLSRDDQRFLADHQWKMDLRNEQFQNDLAKHGIKWRVQDAEDSGLHPLAALGVNPASGGFSASAFNSGSPATSRGSRFATALSNTGQDVSRAIAATQTEDERLRNRAEIHKTFAETDYFHALADQVRNGPQNPPMPNRLSLYRNPDGSVVQGYSPEWAQSISSRPITQFSDDIDFSLFGAGGIDGLRRKFHNAGGRFRKYLTTPVGNRR